MEFFIKEGLLPTNCELDDRYEETVDYSADPPDLGGIEYAYHLEVIKNQRLEFKYQVAIHAINKTRSLVAAGQVLVVHAMDDLPIVAALKREVDDLKKVISYRDKSEEARSIKDAVQMTKFSNIVESSLTCVIDRKDCTPAELTEVLSLKPKKYLHNNDKFIMRNTERLRDVVGASGLRTRPLTEIRAKFKIVGVVDSTPEQFCANLASNNMMHDLVCESIYPVRNAKGEYQNALINCGLDTAAFLEESKKIWVGHKVHKCFEVANIKQCTNCWSYAHTSRKCNSPPCCKKCNSSDCPRKGNCEPYCLPCASFGLQSNHPSRSYLCPHRRSMIEKCKQSVFRLARRKSPPDP